MWKKPSVKSPVNSLHPFQYLLRFSYVAVPEDVSRIPEKEIFSIHHGKLGDRVVMGVSPQLHWQRFYVVYTRPAGLTLKRPKLADVVPAETYRDLVARIFSNAPRYRVVQRACHSDDGFIGVPCSAYVGGGKQRCPVVERVGLSELIGELEAIQELWVS